MSDHAIPMHQFSPYGTWVQTERDAHQAWADLIVEKPRAAQLLHILVANMDKSGAVVATQTALAKAMRTSVATTKRALAVLIEQSWLQTIRLGPERGRVLAYVINSQVAWADTRENMQMAQLRRLRLGTSKRPQPPAHP